MSNPVTIIYAIFGAIQLAAYATVGLYLPSNCGADWRWHQATPENFVFAFCLYAGTVGFMFLYGSGKDAEFKEIERWVESRKQAK
jgi:hypothetical protein